MLFQIESSQLCRAHEARLEKFLMPRFPTQVDLLSRIYWTNMIHVPEVVFHYDKGGVETDMLIRPVTSDGYEWDNSPIYFFDRGAMAVLFPRRNDREFENRHLVPLRSAAVYFSHEAVSPDVTTRIIIEIMNRIYKEADRRRRQVKIIKDKYHLWPFPRNYVGMKEVQCS